RSRRDAQQPERVRRIGVLMAYPESDPEGHALVAAFRDGLSEAWMAGGPQRPGRDSLGDTRRDINATVCARARRAAALPPPFTRPPPHRSLQQTSSIPVIFATVSDPVGSGFVASLAPQKF